MQPPFDTDDYTLPSPHPMSALVPSPEVGECNLCSTATNYMCSLCTTPAYYCNPQHIIEDWGVHSKQCNAVYHITPAKARSHSLAIAQDTAYDCAPSEDPSTVKPDTSTVDETVEHARAMYADGNTNEITFVDVPLIPRDTGDHVLHYGWVPVLMKFLQDPAARTVITFDGRLQPLPSPIVLYFSTDEFGKEQHVNAAVVDLFRGSDVVPDPWHGPLLVMKAVCYPVVDFVDVEPKDLFTVCEYIGRCN